MNRPATLASMVLLASCVSEPPQGTAVGNPGMTQMAVAAAAPGSVVVEVQAQEPLSTLEDCGGARVEFDGPSVGTGSADALFELPPGSHSRP